VSHEPEAQSHRKLRRRDSNNENSRHLGKKHFDRLMLLGMVLGYFFLGLTIITIALSIFYKPFQINLKPESTQEQPSVDKSVKNLRQLSIKKDISATVSSNNPEELIQDVEAMYAYVPPQRRSLEVDRVKDIFIRLPDLDGNQVFTCSTPVITPFVRKTAISANIAETKDRLMLVNEKDRHKKKWQPVQNSSDPPSTRKGLRTPGATSVKKKLAPLDVKKTANQAHKWTDEKENYTDNALTTKLAQYKRGTSTTPTPDVHTDLKGLQERLTPAFMKATCSYEDSKDSGSVSLKEVKSCEL